MRSSALLFAVPFLLAGCPDAHNRLGDAGPLSDGGCSGGGSPLICVPSCGGDAGLPPICSGGSWVCPPGTVDLSTCPPTCHGPPPAGCHCEGTAWVCEPTICPSGIDPWNPEAPGNACSTEGSTCTSGGTSACGAGMWCTCEGGRWSCAVAEPDPACWCGREPEPGSACSEEGMSCGECCPTPGGTGWPAMICEGGVWAPAACPPIECAPVVDTCPVDREPLVGTACSLEGQVCGHACCEGEIVCEGGVWTRGAIADCALCPEFPCGAGSCVMDREYCAARCAPTDGIEYVCEPLPSGCTSCDCLPPSSSSVCEMIDGRPHVRELGFCG